MKNRVLAIAAVALLAGPMATDCAFAVPIEIANNISGLYRDAVALEIGGSATDEFRFAYALSLEQLLRDLREELAAEADDQQLNQVRSILATVLRN